MNVIELSVYTLTVITVTPLLCLSLRPGFRVVHSLLSAVGAHRLVSSVWGYVDSTIR